MDSSIILKNFLDHLPFGVSITNDQGILVYYNDLNGRIEGLDKNQVIGKHISEIYAPSTASSPTLKVLSTGQPIYDLIIVYKTSCGNVVTASHTALPLVKNQKVIGCLCLQQPLDAPTRSYTQAQQKTKQEILFKSMIGSSPSFRASINAALAAADSPSSVLIYGETGSGKEMLARQLHEHSQRAGQPYIAINCSAIPANLLEASLFGSVKGAYTGAENTPGLFEEAHGGTLYLDEIDSMPLELQPKLLRAIQERKVRRVGAVKEKPVNIKIISSFSCDPLQAVEQRRVRPDLFYRLSVVMINIPPLRERIGDLPGLISFFLDKHSRILKKRAGGLTSDVMVALDSYHWPGNVRELENVIEGALNLIQDGEAISLHHLPPYFKKEVLSKGHKSQRLNDEGAVIAPFDKSSSTESTTQSGRADIVQALGQTRGNVAEAARLLGLSRQGLTYKMKKYAVSRRDFTDWE